jgi:hypothetical protein
MTETTDLVPGQKFRVKDGMNITPLIVEVEVTWADAETVWYRKDGMPAVLNTPRARFLEIVQNG